MVSCHSRREMQHGGVCIYALDYLECKEVKEIESVSTDGQIECACIKISSMKCICICIYRTNLGNIDVFLHKLEEIFELILNKFSSYRLICCGDFNINLLEISNNSESFLDILKSYNFRQLVYEPTRVTSTCSSLLDNIFINFEEKLECNITDLALSDHYGQLLCMNERSMEHSMNESVVRRIFSEAKLRDFCTEIEFGNWNDIMGCTEVNRAYSMFANKITVTLNKIFPFKKCKNNVDKGWVTEEIKNLCKQKKIIYKNSLRGVISTNEYKAFCKNLRKHINDAKQTYNNNKIIQSNNKTKAAWSLVNKQIKGNKSQRENSLLKNMSKDKDITPVKILDEANKYFINACPDLNNGEVDLSMINESNQTFSFRLTNANEVKKVIKNLKNKKSVGYDEVPISLLKTAVHEIAEPIAHIINLTFLTGVYPEALKLGYVRAIYKKNEKNKIENYRPITLLSNINKIFEKIVYERIVTYLEIQKILTDRQSGFRRGKNTVRAVYQALKDILNSLNENKETVALCLDLSKAFDSVDHPTLSSKLSRYGIRGVALSLVQSYLSNRKQRVVETDMKGNLIKSDDLTVLRGVPQGSILGPLLYILYVNELPNIVSQNIVMYADDTSMIISERTRNECETRVKESMNELEDWFSKNNLLLNIEKTQLINFSRKGNPENFEIEYNNKIVKPCKSISFLGVTIDCRLDWKEHTEQLCLGLARHSYALKILSRSVSEEVAMLAFHAFVQSKVSYGVVFWGGASCMQRVLILQKRCLRSVCGLRARESCKIVFREKKILTAISLYILESSMFIKKNYDLFSECISDHVYNTRHKSNLQPSLNKYQYLQKNVEFSIKKIWNHLPQRLRNLPLNQFKKQLKLFLVSRAYYTLNEYFEDIVAM